MKLCRSCGTVLSLDEFYSHPEMRDGYLNRCKTCVRARVRKHRQANDSVREYDRRRYRHDPKVMRRLDDYQRRNADFYRTIKYCSQIVYQAVAKGQLIKPTICETCSQEKPLEAAHHDYDKPLDVRWLCRRCHRQWDSLEPKGSLLRAA